jgi:pyruvate,orthophosphate dikinase
MRRFADNVMKDGPGMSELAILTAVRMKGRVDTAGVAACAGVEESAAADALADLLARELVSGGPQYRITKDGKEALAGLVAKERDGIDQAALSAAYHDFDQVNTALKAAITAWQIREDGTPNDHSDPDYDSQVFDKIHRVHQQFSPVLDRTIDTVPRLAQYRVRFCNALDRIDEGESAYVARPILDSYHTVWFEYHEELIGLLGLSRAEEAAAGRAE